MGKMKELYIEITNSPEYQRANEAEKTKILRNWNKNKKDGTKRHKGRYPKSGR